MSARPPVCRLCRGRQLSSIGRIPDSDYFAGRVLDAPLPGGELWYCADCASLFRHPVLKPDDYARLYRTGCAEAWTGNAVRNDLRSIALTIAARTGPQRVLDVGCNTGEFLRMLPASVSKYGIEPSVDAAAVATQGGIQILGPSLEALTPDARFDVITIIDVIEHLEDPLALLDVAVAHLAPGGLLIIASADPCFPAWRKFFRARFWYSAFPEHISFPSLSALDRWRGARQLGPPVVERIRYRAIPAWKAVVHLGGMLIFMMSPTLLSLLGRVVERAQGAGKPRRRCFSPGAPGVFTDHHILTFRRAGN